MLPRGTVSVNEVYDPETDSWATRSPPSQETSGSASAVVDDKIYVLGWEVIQIYDPAKDSWSAVASSPMYTAAIGATAGMDAPKRIYFFDENRTDVFNPANNSWTSGAVMPTGRLMMRAAVVDDFIYVVGGRSGQHGYMTMMFPSVVNERYTPFGYGTIPHQQSPEPFPTVIVAAASGASVAVIGAGLLIYFKKRKH
jgi:N-acetylneuraminic acid mutarotase